MSPAVHWEQQYQANRLVWDTGRPSTELLRVVRECQIQPCRAIEFGCGTGTNAVWLARQGFEVTAVDVSARAVSRARERAAAARVRVEFRAADLRDYWKLGAGYEFFFDRGCYHAVRRVDQEGYLQTVDHCTAPRGMGLILTGNAREPEDDVGPPVLSACELRTELGRLFHILHLREFRFDALRAGEKRYLAWSCLVQKLPSPGL
jgi:SAM-dependent methyltransferase